MKPKSKYLLGGLAYGLIMFMVLVVVKPSLEGREIPSAAILKGLAIWVPAGLLFGLVNQWVSDKNS